VPAHFTQNKLFKKDPTISRRREDHHGFQGPSLLLTQQPIVVDKEIQAVMLFSLQVPSAIRCLFEHLPAEMLHMIIESIDDVDTFAALLRASPSCFRYYVAVGRQAAMTRLAVRIMVAKGMDCIKPSSCVHVAFRGCLYTWSSLQSALSAYWRYKPCCSKPLRFNLGQLRAIFALLDVVIWNLEGTAQGLVAACSRSWPGPKRQPLVSKTEICHELHLNARMVKHFYPQGWKCYLAFEPYPWLKYHSVHTTLQSARAPFEPASLSLHFHLNQNCERPLLYPKTPFYRNYHASLVEHLSCCDAPLIVPSLYRDSRMKLQKRVQNVHGWLADVPVLPCCIIP
jgi:hypothetical protein